MKNKNYFFCMICLVLGLSLNAQRQSQGPELIITPSEFNIVQPITSDDLVPLDLTPREINNRSWVNYPTNFNALPKGMDPLLADENNRANVLPPLNSPLVNFDGAILGVHSGAVPPDPTGAVGPNHYIHAWNSGFAIFDKSGALLQAHAALGTLWPGENSGDPIVLYDRYADRFVITQFDSSGPPYGLLFAVSQGPDPVNDGWFTYRYDFPTFQDYPHYSVWHDAYYITTNSIPNGNDVYAVNRDKMIAGDPDAEIVAFNLVGASPNPAAVFAPMPMNSVGPNLPDSSLPGYIMMLQDDSYAGGVDRIEFWEVDLDWVTPSNSTISGSTDINTTPFDSFVAPFGTGEVPQPGTAQAVDGITGLISYTMNYWNFGGTNSATINFNVDVSGDNTRLGIRWMELRETAGAWSIFQEGTFAPDDDLYRFLGNMCMDQNGNIGLAYSVGNASKFPSLRYTGRFASSPPGEMVFAEQTIIDGIASQDFSNRFGDYSHMSLDPSDNETFWFASEYIGTGGLWRTRISAFKVAPNGADDVGVTAITSPNDATLSDSESITIELINYGSDPQVNIPVWYQIDGGAMVMDVVPGPLNSTETTSFTFAVPADLGTQGQTYTIIASTDLSGDIDTGNDSITKEVKNLPPDDLGVVEIISPITNVGLGATETISVTVENFGGESQSNFDVTYSIDNVAPVTEQIAGPLDPGQRVTFGFSATGDFSSIGTVYGLNATTSLPGDFDETNDSTSSTVYNAGCIPGGTNGSSTCQVDGIKRFVLGTIDVGDGSNGCSSTGQTVNYADRTDLSTDLDRSEGNNTHLLQSQHNYTAAGGTLELLSVWIDFNDNGVFEELEQLIIAENYTVAEALSDFDLIIPTDAPLGSHILRARSIDPGTAPGDPNDPCADVAWGETQDYTVNIVDTSLSIDDYALKDADFQIYDRGDNNFEVILKPTGFTDELVITMHNVLGQKLVRNRVYYENGQYRYMLQLNGLAAGVYLVRLGTNQFGRVKRIIVK